MLEFTIYIYGCNLTWWALKRQQSSKMPSFIVKNGPKRQPQTRGCFSCMFGFFFLIFFFVFFPLFLLISCCFMPSWNPETAHQMRLQAIYIWLECTNKNQGRRRLKILDVSVCARDSNRSQTQRAQRSGHYERGLVIGGISRISKIAKFSRVSRGWSDSPLVSTVWRFSRISKKNL